MQGKSDNRPNIFVLNPISGQLLKNSTPVNLRPKAFQLLEYFVKYPNKLVSSTEILEQLWPDSYVTKGLVREYVHDVRLVLDDNPKNPSYIQTVHGRGYRYVGGIEVADCQNFKPFTDLNERSNPPVIAVLPLKNLSDINRWNYFADGITNDIVTALSRFPDLAVIANSSSSSYKNLDMNSKQIGLELNAEYVLEGNIQVWDSQISVTTQLIDTKDSVVHWAEQYDRDSEGIFEIVDDIVQQVSGAIAGFDGVIFRAERNKISGKPPSSLKVYEMYLRGFELEEQFTKKSNLKAIDILEKAIKIDPDYSRLWIILGWTYYLAGEYGWIDDPCNDYKERQQECFKKAVELDPNDPIALKEMAILLIEEGDHEGATRLLKKALHLGRNFSSLLINSARIYFELTGDKNGATSMVNKAFRLNPVLPRKWYYIQQVRLNYFTSEFEMTLNAAKNSAVDFPETLYFTAFALAQLGYTKKAHAKRKEFKERYPEYNFEQRVKRLTLIRKQSIDLYWEGFNKAGFIV